MEAKPDPNAQPAPVLVDEREQSDTGASSSVDPLAAAGTSTLSPTSAARPTSPASPPASPPLSPPSPEQRRVSAADTYYATRGKTDRLGNPIPERRRGGGAMASVFGRGTVQLPGDLGPNDPRRPRSPAPASLPGDLGPNDPRRPRSRANSPAPGSPAGRQRSDSNASEAPPEGARIMKDPKEPKAEEHDSDEDADADNDNDTEGEDSKRGRIRKRPEPGRTTSGKSVNVREDSEDSVRDAQTTWTGAKPDPTKGESKLSMQGDPKIKVTGPGGKKRVHPTTAFDLPSGVATPLTSDDESHSELRAAQKLSLTMSNIHSTPSAHRVIRQIIRGDYEHFQKEAEEGRKRQRMYLVATDVSAEAEYALEWTIGTVLRDGDTLFAVYAMDDESAGESGAVDIGHGAESVRDTAQVLQRLPTVNLASANAPGPSPLAKAGQLGANPNGSSSDIRSRSRNTFSSAETERRRGLEDVTARCVRLLRKTRLQVRVVVEVFHCKSPKHMITEVIDYLSPTLVVIGSRGRSNVKGVLLGSFSNYLVTKSSVPVMVARRKLRKHSKTARNPDGTAVPYSGTGRVGRLSNVIVVPKGKGLRVDGWERVGID